MAQDESRDDRDTAGEEPGEEGETAEQEPERDENGDDARQDEGDGDGEQDDDETAEQEAGSEQEDGGGEDGGGEDGGGENGSGSGQGDDGSETEDASNISAPSIGPNTEIEREPPEERLARHEQSSEDAMGLDKRREVVGQSYGPSKKRQALLYGIALAVIALLAVGGIIATNQLDQPPETQKDEAPWSSAKADQRPVEPLQ